MRVVALGRDEADAQLLARAWRYVAYRDAPPTLVPSRRAQVEYEAYLSLLARDAGVDTPRVVVAGTHGALALLVVEQITGTELYDLDADALSDALLDRTWAELRTLHAARVAHGKLDGKHVLIDGSTAAHRGVRLRVEQRPVPPDRGRRRAAPRRDHGDRRRRARGGGRGARHGPGDGRRRAPDAAARRRSRAGPTTRFGGRGQLDDRLDELRHVGAAATGTEAPELRRLFRVQPRSLLMAVGALDRASASC